MSGQTKPEHPADQPGLSKWGFFSSTWSLPVTIALILCGIAACQATSPVVVTREIEVTRPVFFEREIEVTREVEIVREVAVPVEVTQMVERPVETGELGSVDRPFQLVFLPGYPAALIEVRGGFLIDFLTEQTGFHFTAVMPESEAEAVAVLCGNPQETIAFLTPASYVGAADRCNAQVTHAVTRFDVPYQLGMLVARRDRVINVAEDLAFKTIGVPSFDDLATYRWFTLELAERGIQPIDYVELGTSSAALLAVLNAEVDVAAAIFNPPIMPGGERAWEIGIDSPEIWRQLEIEPVRDPIGYVDVAGGPEAGGYRIRDARAALFDDYPEIFGETKIVILSAPIPNEAIVLGRDFPFGAVQEILPVVEQFLGSEACGQSVCASDFYQWDGATRATDDFYDVWRQAAAVPESPADSEQPSQ